MKEQLINYIIKSSKEILLQMVDMTVEENEVIDKEIIDLNSSIGVVVGITGIKGGQIIFNIPEAEAKKIASIMLGGVPIVTLDELSRVAICQVTNLIVGNTVTSLINNGIVLDMTPSSIVEGDNITYTVPGYSTTSIPLKTKDSVIDINICLEKKDSNRGD